MKRMLNCAMLLLTTTVFSCHKDSSDVLNYLVVGRISHEIIYHDIQPDTVLTSWEIESILPVDINDDNVADIHISVLNQYIFGGMSLSNSELRIETLNNATSVLLDSVYPEVLSFGDTIFFEENWGHGNLLLLHSSEDCCPPTGTTFHEGLWKERSENYIGIRYFDQLGWLKIGIQNYTSVKVFDYALMK